MPESIAGIGCTTRDQIITASAADIDAFLGTQRPGHPVQFALTEDERDAYRRFGAERGHHAWTPGGTVSNTLCSAAATRIERNLSLAPIAWRGPAEYDDSIVSDVGLAHLRAWGIDLQPDYRVDFAREAYCLVDDASGEVHRIAIYERNARIAGQPHWTPCDLLIMTMHDVMNGDAALLAFVRRCRELALLVADWRGSAARELLGQFSNLRYLIGQRRDFVELGLCDADARHFDAVVEHVECVGTDGPRPVVWKAAAVRTASHRALDATDAASHVLGAGDGYAGAFLASRAAGVTPDDAHAIALARARRVMQAETSHAPRGEDLNAIFPPHIDRRSASTTEASFATRLHLSPGLVVTSCGQTGIDQLAIATARSFGITAFAIMPDGKRTESSELGIGGPDRLEGAIVLELATPSYRYCTWANVYCSDGTILLDYARSEGSEETRKAAAWLGRPLLELHEIEPAEIPSRVAEWIDRHGVRVVNCAGNRMSRLDDAARADATLALQRALLAAAAAIARRDCGMRVLPSVHPGASTDVILGAPNSPVMRHLFRTFFRDTAIGTESFAPGELTWSVPSHALQIVFVRSRDLPAALRRGWVDYAIFGQDVGLEDGDELAPMFPIGVDPCCLVEIVRDKRDERTRWASAWPDLARVLVGRDVVPVTGCVEAWLHTGAIDAAVDTYQTGRAVEENALRIARRFRTVHAWMHRRADAARIHPIVVSLMRWLHG